MVMNRPGSLGILRSHYKNMPHIPSHDGQSSWKSGNFSFVMGLGLCCYCEPCGNKMSGSKLDCYILVSCILQITRDDSSCVIFCYLIFIASLFVYFYRHFQSEVC